MRTPTRRNVFASGVVPTDLTHATESGSLYRASRSSNPFCKGTDGDDEPFRRIGFAASSSEVPTSPPSRPKRTYSNDYDSANSCNLLKRIRSHRSTPVMNGGSFNELSKAGCSAEGTWKHRSSILSRITDHQLKTDRILYDVCLVLREVDKCNSILRSMRLAM